MRGWLGKAFMWLFGGLGSFYRANLWPIRLALIAATLSSAVIYHLSALHSAAKSATAACQASVLAAVKEGQARQAAQLIAAYKASEEVAAHVDSEKKAIAEENADLLRRIAAYRVRLAGQIRAGGVPEARGDSPIPVDPATSTAVLAEQALSDLAGCSLDYATLAVQVEGINRLVSDSKSRAGLISLIPGAISDF